jgi:hypothetical protein
MTEAEELELLELEAEAAAAAGSDDVKEEKPSLLMRGLSAAGKALDYAGGIARTAIANRPEVLMAEALTAGKPVDQIGRGWEEMKQALLANPKTSSELMESRGVPEMGSMELPLLGRVTGRGALGMAADIATDPLTYVGGGMAAKGIKSAAEELYSRAFKNVDLALEKAGNGEKAMSKLLLGQTKAVPGSKLGLVTEAIPTGSSKQMAATVDDMAEKLLEQKTAQLAAADATGRNVDLLGALEKYSDDLDAIIRGNNENAAQAAMTAKGNLQGQIERLKYNRAQGVPLLASEADAIKTSLYEDLPENVWNTLTRTKTGQRLAKNVAKLTKVSIEQAVPEVKETNRQLGILLSARKPLSKEVGKETTRNAVTSVDGALAWLSPKSAITKKAADISKEAWFNTKAGKALLKNADTLGMGGTGLLLQSLRPGREEE